MPAFQKSIEKIKALRTDTQLANDRKKAVTTLKNLLFSMFRLVVLIGICYIILGPLTGILTSSFYSDADRYNPMVYLIPQEPTLERYSVSGTVMEYEKTLANTLILDIGLMILQILVCSLVGYGFARFQFPLKKLLFGFVVVMIVLPTNTIMLPLYMTFRNFGPAGNLLSTPWPMVIMTLLGCGLRSGLYIYIFNQFFRGLPKEIEEAAFVDGAGMFYTYSRIMLVNAIPSVVTVSIFSLVWQYNETFYAKLFNLSTGFSIAKRITTLQASVSNLYDILDPSVQRLYVYAGIILVILPVSAVYILLQKYFIEGVERSGIVG